MLDPTQGLCVSVQTVLLLPPKEKVMFSGVSSYVTEDLLEQHLLLNSFYGSVNSFQELLLLWGER